MPRVGLCTLLSITFCSDDLLPQRQRPTPPPTQAQSLAEILLNRQNAHKKATAAAKLRGCRILPHRQILPQAALPKDLSLQQHDFPGEEFTCAASDVFPLTWPGATSFAHEEIWPFLSYLNVSPKCLPAIVAKPLAQLP